MKNKTLLIIFLSLCNYAFVFGQVLSTDGVRFVNIGEMNTRQLNVFGDMLMADPVGNPAGNVAVNIVIPGNVTGIRLTGSFFHDATGNVFAVTNTDWSDRSMMRGITTNIGIIEFSDTVSIPGRRRYISSTNPLTFDRVANYIAFPTVFSSTVDTIFVTPTMGFDVNTFVATNGLLYLASDLVTRGSNQYIYTASLRAVTEGGPFNISRIHMEKRVREFREPAANSGLAATMLMPFAPPFNSMRAGYFAGNWIRRPLIDAATNSFRFPYGNESEDGVIINSNQYLISAGETMTPGTGHLIRLQRAGGTNQDVYGMLKITAGENHDIDKFVFNGMPFPSMGFQLDGSVVRSQNLLNQTVQVGLPQTQNWVVGNSFTSGLNGQGIAEYLMGIDPSSPLNATYMPFMFIYHHGATAYETHPIWDYVTGSVPQNIPDIQAMGVFMVGAYRENTVSENVVIGTRFQVHTGGIPAVANTVVNPLSRSARSGQNSVLNFTLSPDCENTFVFSRTSVRLHENADVNADNLDVVALTNASNQMFHLYGTNRSRQILQQNALPFTAPLAMLSVSPAAESMSMLLTVEGAENFATEVVELFDRQTGAFLQDLRANNSYWFVLNPGDNPDRFEVRFTAQPTNIDNTTFAEDWQAFSFGGDLVITDLNAALLYSEARIHGISGVLHIQQPITNVPEERINISSLPAGVYLLSIGNRTVKFIR